MTTSDLNNDTSEWCQRFFASYVVRADFVGGTYGPPLADPTPWRDVDYVVVLKILAYSVLFAGGLLGNVSVILAVCLNRSMRNTTNYYVANLAVADALICLFCLPIHAFGALTKEHHFVLGEFMCKFSPAVQVTCLTSSAFLLSAISCDRLMAILFPLRARVTKQRTSVVVATIWILSAAVSIPFLLTRVHEEYPYANFVQRSCRERWPVAYHYDARLLNLPHMPAPCYMTQPLRIAYHAVISVVLFFLPLFVTVTAYSLILWRLWRTEVPGEQCAQNVDTHTRAKRKVNKMVFLVLVALFVCGTPLQFILLYETTRIPDIHGMLPSWFGTMNWFAYFLAYTNSFLNPFIYGGFNKEYLKGFCSICRCGNSRDPYTSSVRSRLTFTTGVSWRGASKSQNRISQKSTVEMKLLQQLADGKNRPNALNS